MSDITNEGSVTVVKEPETSNQLPKANGNRTATSTTPMEIEKKPVEKVNGSNANDDDKPLIELANRKRKPDTKDDNDRPLIELAKKRDVKVEAPNKTAAKASTPAKPTTTVQKSPGKT